MKRFKLNPNPLTSKMFNIRIKHGKFYTEDITPFCEAHDIPMYDFRNKKYFPQITYTRLLDSGYVLTEEERFTLYEAFAQNNNSKGWYMVYDPANVKAYFAYKNNEDLQ